MKQHGSDFELKTERTNDLIRAYYELLKKRQYIRNYEIYKDLVNMPSSRFWVSDDRATIVIYSMLKGDKLLKMRQTKREMFQEIYRRVMSLRESDASLSLFECVCIVVRQPAPKFYITPVSATIYITKAKKKWYEERKRKLIHLFM